MKNLNFIKWLLIGLTALFFGACSEEDSNVGTGGPSGTLTFTQADGADYEVTFTVENAVGVNSYSFDFGDGTSEVTSESSITHNYLAVGDHDVAVTLFGDSDQAKLTTTVTVTQVDVTSICNNELYTLLTGGCVNEDPGSGLAWKLSNADSSMLVGPGTSNADFGSVTYWWASGENHWYGKNGDNVVATETMKSRFTFNVLPNKVSVEGTHVIHNYQDDETRPAWNDYEAPYPVDFPKEFGFSITEENGKHYLILNEGGYLAYTQTVDGVTPNKYEIYSLTDSVLELRYENILAPEQAPNKNFRYLRYVRADIDEGVPDFILKDQKDVAISASFNGTMDATVGSETIAFINEADVETSFVADPLDPTTQVLSYTKNGMIDDIQIELPHILDLSSSHTFKLKVYFPSTNDYDTVDPDKQDWTDTEGKLASMVNLKLHDTIQGGSGWKTEATVRVSSDLRDQWVELEFSYNGLEVLNRENGGVVWEDAAQSDTYDKILIQIGGEGHVQKGTFYIKDFELVQ
ncbi:PKD domain-containing protein [Flammeovirga sp. MY04]|uniref:PKD domain-containing protein n=1 Tax=Flammeovirga sp. MY04 TaxID=1191459 RepID=UPI0008061C31|nr:PKD domain-containing protein [Flammeovirga sp. MY04]ANQ50872.1 PKD domain-containing protein [Flammeovirga sp. MY04]